MQKVKIPVFIKTTANKYIGDVEVEKKEDFEAAAEDFWLKSGGESIQTNISNDFEVGDSDIDLSVLKDFEFYREKAK